MGNTSEVHYPHKGIDWDSVPLGEKSDLALARELGVAPQVVWQARTRRGIPAVNADARRQLQEIDWDALRLGQRPDSVIAREIGLSRRTVCAERRKRGIPAFIGMVLTQEGQTCRSICEAMYDAWLHDQPKAHEHEVRVEALDCIADFLVEDVLIEVIGMTAFDRYAERYESKRRAYREAGIAVQWVTADEVSALFDTCRIPLRFRFGRNCLDCNEPTHDLVKAHCRTCYMRRWHRTDRETRHCDSCGRVFAKPRGQPHQRFCSRGCYWRSLELLSVSWEELDRRLEEKSIRQVALDLGLKPSTLYMRLRRRSLRAV